MPETNFSDRGLGRLPSADERDKNFPVRRLLSTLPPIYKHKSRWYLTGPVLDQGTTSQCVGFSWRQWMMSAPTMTRPTVPPDEHEIYFNAQKNDEWEGEDYEGSSVRGAAKYLQSIGVISTYYWAESTEDMKAFILNGLGTVVVGTDWLTQMFSPDSKGFVTVGGNVAGGHAYLCMGYSKPRDAFRFLNSWGPDFGQKGRFWIHTEEFAGLLSSGGEACCAVEIRRK